MSIYAIHNKKYSRIISIVLTLMLLFSLQTPFVFAGSAPSPEADFDFEDGVILEYTGADENVVIPDTIGGEPVTEIVSCAFQPGGTVVTTIKSVTIPATVTYIDDFAFNSGGSDLEGLKVTFLGEVPPTLGLMVFEYGVIFYCPESCEADYESSDLAEFLDIYDGTLLTFEDEPAAEEPPSSGGTSPDTETPAPPANPSPTIGEDYTLEYQVVPAGVIVSKFTYTGTKSMTTNPVAVPQTVEGLTVIGIGDEAFKNGRASGVTLPNTIETIGKEAFAVPDANIGVSSAPTTLDLSKTKVKSIEESTFKKSRLKTITFPTGLESIGREAFSGCAYLEKIELANTQVESIGDEAFMDAIKIGTLTVPSTLKTIGKNAFANSLSSKSTTLKTVDLSQTQITAIPEGAFRINSALTTVKLPATLKSIGDEAFMDARAISMINWPASLETIGKNAFANSSTSSTSLPKLELKGTKITAIEEGTFKHHTAMASITFPDGLESIGDFAFAGCSKLATVDLSGTTLKTIGKSAFAFDGTGFMALATVKVPSTLESIGKEAFLGSVGTAASNNKFTTINLEDATALTTIDDSAFKYCHAMTSIKIPASATNIHNEAFTMMNGLKEVVVDPANPVYSSSDGVLFKNHVLIYYPSAKDSTAYAVPEGTTEIANDAFKLAYTNKTAPLERVTFPTTLKKVGDRAFMQTKLRKVTISSDIEFGIYAYDGCKSLTDIIIKEGVTTIPKALFFGASKVESVKLPSTLKHIGDYAFDRLGYEVKDMPVDITFPEGLETIGEDAFVFANIDHLKLPSTLTKLGDRAFYLATIQSLEFAPNAKIESIGPYAFNHCKQLASVTLPTSVKKLETGAFSHCYALKSINLPNSITTLEDFVFAGSALESITLPESIKTMGAGTFKNCLDLKSAALPKYLEALDTCTFEVCEGLTDVTLPETMKLKSVPLDTFFGCKTLKTLYLPQVIERTEACAFSNCDDLETIEFANKDLKRSPFDCFSVDLSSYDDQIGSLVFDEATGKYFITFTINDPVIKDEIEKDVKSGDYTENKDLLKSSPTGFISREPLGSAATCGCASYPAGTTSISPSSNPTFKYKAATTPSNPGNTDSTKGSGSGSGGSKTPTPAPAPAPAPVPTTPLASIVAPKTNVSTANVTATADTAGNATASITEAQMATVIEQAKETAKKNDGENQVEIKVAAAANSNKVEAQIPQKAIAEMSKSGLDGLTVSSPVASVTFDAKALATIAGSASEDVKVTASRVETASLSEEAKKAVGDHPVFDFSVTIGDKNISSFGGNVTLSVPYTAKAGDDLNAIVIYYINAEGKPELVQNCRYDYEAGRVIFQTNHFSQYAVGLNPISFQDVKDSAWYAEAVCFLSARGIASGTGGSTFQPNAKLTRGQFMVMVMRAYGISPEENPSDNFSDAGNQYYTGYLAAAKKLEITKGIGDNKFAPEKEITRQEMFTLLYNSLNQMDQLPKSTSTRALTDYTDHEMVASWAKDSMGLLVKSGTIEGSNRQLAPTDTTTRAQMAQVLYNLMSK